MAERDVLGSFDYDQFSGAGMFLKWKADHPQTLRILTTDPVVSQTEFTDKKTGEVNLNVRFNFIVYNLTEGKAQILGASPAMSKKFGELHMDPDFGANIRKMDIKITPTGEGLERRYDIQVLRHSGNETQLTLDQIQEAQSIALEDLVNDSKGRLSEWDPKLSKQVVGSSGSNTQSGYEKAKAIHEGIKENIGIKPDEIIDDFNPDEPINLDDIPF